MELFQNLTDDQIALIGGLVALAASGTLMYVSYFMGPAARRGSQSSFRGPQRGSRVQSAASPTPQTAETASRKAA